MPRRRSSSSSSDTSSDDSSRRRPSKKSKSSRRRSRSGSRERSRRSKKTRQRRSRSRSRDRRDKRSSRRSSRERPRRRSRSDSRSRQRRKDKRRSPSPNRSTSESPSPPPPPPPPSVPTREESLSASSSAQPDSGLSRLRRDRALRDIEAPGFQPAGFVSSASAKLAQIALPGEAGAEARGGAGGFEFGTALEAMSAEDPSGATRVPSAKEKMLAEINKEGLCHPDLFGDERDREERWVRKLFRLRRSLMAGEGREQDKLQL